ncbi:unnamed protein product [Cylicocyclus nassatus]|uniref:Uncharacterized protein n=1 Tax=Cylicocyclus nassatus TaxID=53992 RepID=A0AA36GZQ0_CYLNA|nr:unnamed protein product [Cylicocyclus nassatus]
MVENSQNDRSLRILVSSFDDSNLLMESDRSPRALPWSAHKNSNVENLSKRMIDHFEHLLGAVSKATVRK